MSKKTTASPVEGQTAPDTTASLSDLFFALLESLPGPGEKILFGEAAAHEDGTVSFHPTETLRPGMATYVNTGAFLRDRAEPDGYMRARSANIEGCYFIMADDIGTKAAALPVEPTWKIETSPGNFQWGYVWSERPTKDEQTAAVAAFAKAGYCDRGASGPVRWCRIPGSRNHKKQFTARLVELHPERRFTLQQLMDDCGVVPEPPKQRERKEGNSPLGIELEQLPELLEKLDPDLPRWPSDGPGWTSIAAGLYDEFGDEAYPYWLEWSRKGKKFISERDCGDEWDNVANSTRKGIGFGSVVKWASKAGWKPPVIIPDGMFGDVGQQQPAQQQYDITPIREQPMTAIHDALKVVFPDPFPGPMAAAHAALLPLANKPQPEMLTFSLLIGMASCVSGRYYFGNDQRANLFGIGVLPTGGGKDYVRICGEKVAHAGGATRIDMPASGEGLEDSLMSYESLLMAIDEIGHMLAAANSNNAQAHHIKLKREILRLFSASRTKVKGRPKAGLPGRAIDHPCLNILGFTTPAVLGRALTGNDVASGELPRYLMVFGREGVPLRRAKGKINLPDETLGKAKALKLALLFAGEAKDEDGMIEVKATVDGDAALDAAMAYFNGCPQEGGFGAELATRSYEKVERIAIVLAVWCEPVKPVITKEMVEWAVAFVIASNASMNHFVETHMHSAACIADAETVVNITRKILAGIIKPQNENQKKIIDMGYVPRSLLLMRSKMDAKKFADAFDYLIQTERGEVVYFPFTLAASGATRNVPALKLAGTATVSVANDEKCPVYKLIGED